MYSPNPFSPSRRRFLDRGGFTLAEILLAMLVFSIAISTILALLARSIETADEILLKDEAINLSSALDAYMTELPFEDAYDIIESSQPDPGFVYAYQYRAIPNTDQGDGTLAPFTGDLTTSTMGVDYVITPGIRDTIPPAESAAREGRLFHIRLSESPANPYGIKNGVGNLPSDPNDPGDFYDEAILVVFAEFVPVPVAVAPAADADSVFSFNFAVRR